MATFLKFLGGVILAAFILSQYGDEPFERLHLMLDTSNGMLSLLLALFLLAERYSNIDNRVRMYLVVAFAFSAFTEILHALVGIEWSGTLGWIQEYSHTLRPATWPPSTYVLPLALAWILWLEHRKVKLSLGRFTLGVAVATVLLLVLSGMLPKYADTGVLGMQRPTQIPLLLLWIAVIAQCWRVRASHPLYEGMVWMGVLLFLSDLFMVYSTAPHEKMAIMAHAAKFIAYLYLHFFQMRIAAEDSRGRKAAEVELRASEQYNRTLFDSSPIGLALCRMDGKLVDINQAYADIVGRTIAETKGLTYWEITPQSYADQEQEQLRQLSLYGHYGPYVKEYIHKDGHLVPVKLEGLIITRNNENFIWSAVENITARKATESALRESEQNFHGMFDNAADGIMMAGMDGCIREVNPEACRMHGYTHDEFVGKHVTEWLLPEYVEKFGEAIAAIQAGNAYTSETINRRKDGTTFPVEVRVTQLGYRGEQVLLGFVRDISERKQAEAALQESRARLVEAQRIAQVGNWELNLLNNRLTWSEEVYRLFELDKNNFEASYEAFLNAIHPDDRADVDAAYSHSLETREPYEITHRLKMADGRVKWVTERCDTFFDADGRPVKSFGTIQDVSVLKRAELEIRDLAFFDPLTGLPNRRLLMDRLNLALSVSARNQQFGALLFIDMDKFKMINDTLGHDIGDLLLVEVAARIKAHVREIDTVARLGGDEFVVLLEEIDANLATATQKAALIAEKMRAELAAPYQLQDHMLHSSPSIGVSLYLGTEKSVDALLKSADIAMYQAKEAGRNSIRFFDPAMQHAVEEHAALEADLRQALPQRQLHLYYQIQMDRDRRPFGAEALIRWIHPTRGMVSPQQFIPLAEEGSLIVDIGDWVLDSACHQLSLWAKHQNTAHLLIAVNVSARQFKQVDFVEKVSAALIRHQIEPDRLKLELTESVVLDDVQGVVARMQALKSLGVRLSMDDFGTGYSSLSCLKQLPLDQIKIDQSFVRDMLTDPNDAVMVRAIIDMAHNFRLKVIAEGVETEAQLNFLKNLGCMAYQGYYFSKPVPIDKFAALLKQG